MMSRVLLTHAQGSEKDGKYSDFHARYLLKESKVCERGEEEDDRER